MSRFERRAVLWTSLATFFTGVGYLYFKYFVTTDDPFAVVNHPLEPWFLNAHVLASPLLVLAIGSVAIRHVWAHYRSDVRTARRTGLVTACSMGPMILSGYLIQVVTGVGWLRALALVHIALGLLFGIGLMAHHEVLRRRGDYPTIQRE